MAGWSADAAVLAVPTVDELPTLPCNDCWSRSRGRSHGMPRPVSLSTTPPELHSNLLGYGGRAARVADRGSWATGWQGATDPHCGRANAVRPGREYRGEGAGR